MKGEWCPYRECLFCQEETDCLNCEVYYATMPVPYKGGSIEEIVKDSSSLFGCQRSLTLDNGSQIG